MAPLRRKKGTSPTASASPARIPSTRNSPIPQLSPSRSVVIKTPMKSPLRQARHAGITKNQKAVLLENLNLEITERAKKLRAQYTMQARALKQRIEMRINRVPKKLWGAKMGELLAQSGPAVIAGNSSGLVSTKSNVVTVKEFVEDLKRLSDGGEKENPQSARLVVPKKRTAKKTTTASAREQMPPPPVPSAANSSRPLALSPSKSNLPPTSTSPTYLLSSSPTTTRTAVKSSTKDSTKTTKAPTRTIRKIIPSSGSQVSNSSRTSSRATTRSSTDTAVTSAGSGYENSAGTRGTKASQAKAKAAAGTSANSGLKRGGVKGTGSNGSLKENRVAGVKEKKASTTKLAKDPTTTATGGRVLRSRK